MAILNERLKLEIDALYLNYYFIFAALYHYLSEKTASEEPLGVDGYDEVFDYEEETIDTVNLPFSDHFLTQETNNAGRVNHELFNVVGRFEKRSVDGFPFLEIVLLQTAFDITKDEYKKITYPGEYGKDEAIKEIMKVIFDFYPKYSIRESFSFPDYFERSIEYRQSLTIESADIRKQQLPLLIPQIELLRFKVGTPNSAELAAYTTLSILYLQAFDNLLEAISTDEQDTVYTTMANTIWDGALNIVEIYSKILKHHPSQKETEQKSIKKMSYFPKDEEINQPNGEVTLKVVITEMFSENDTRMKLMTLVVQPLFVFSWLKEHAPHVLEEATKGLTWPRSLNAPTKFIQSVFKRRDLVTAELLESFSEYCMKNQDSVDEISSVTISCLEASFMDDEVPELVLTDYQDGKYSVEQNLDPNHPLVLKHLVQLLRI